MVMLLIRSGKFSFRLNEAADSAEKIKQNGDHSLAGGSGDIVCEAGLDVR
jgi:hypothetical protein